MIIDAIIDLTKHVPSHPVSPLVLNGISIGVELFPIFGGNLDVTDSVDSFGYKETEKIHADVWKSKSASHIAFFILYRLHYRKCCQNKHDF